MRKQAPIMEWQIAQSDAEWERLSASLALDVAKAADDRRRQKHNSKCVVALLLLLAGIGGIWWYADQPGLHQAEVKSNTITPQEVMEVTHRSSQLMAHMNDLMVEAVEIQGDQAVVRVVTSPKSQIPAYRQTRFYEYTSSGWQRIEPDAGHWGPEQRLETPSLLFHFRQRDAAAVTAVATQIEALYITLRRNFGLPITQVTTKLVINISVTQRPGTAAFWSRTYEYITVASPAVYWAPVALSDTELLAQSIALPLLDHLLTQAIARHRLSLSWQPLLNGLRLWQVWDMNLPLSAWREEVVKWVYQDQPVINGEQALVQPEHYEQLCAEHTLWTPHPRDIGIPLTCTELDQDKWYFALLGPREPLIRLKQFALVPLNDFGVSPPPVAHPGQTVALATLVAYAVNTYGRERLPALVTGLDQYENWETLIPSVFGVSPTEFEAGWQVYLATHYIR